MNKEEYFAKSHSQKLPLRCPILNYCMRRAYTIYFSSYRDLKGNIVTILKSHGELPDDFDVKKIDVQGESPEWIGGSNNYFFSGFCPEVNLFEGGHALLKTRVSATSASYDKDWRHNQFRTNECGHFSECPEYNVQKIIRATKSSPKKRRKIPLALRFLILDRDKSTCKICGAKAEDGVKLEVDHITPLALGGKDSLDNLRTLCGDCNRGKADKIL